MRGLGPHILPSTNCGDGATSPCAAIRGGGAGQANPSQACPRVCPATESKPRGYGARVRTMWAQNTLLIETANARDVARCGVAVQKKNPRARPGGFQLVGDEGA